MPFFKVSLYSFSYLMDIYSFGTKIILINCEKYKKDNQPI